MDRWDVALLAVAGYVAILTLVRLMARYRDDLLEKFRREMEQEKRLRKTQAGKQKQQAFGRRRAG